MRIPRISLGTLMALVVAAAVDLALIDAYMDGDHNETFDLLVLGALPMVSLLMIGWPALALGFAGRRRITPSLLGFEAFGGMSLLLFAGLAVVAPDAIVNSIQKLGGALGLGSTHDPVRQVVEFYFLILLLLLPHCLSALLGACLLGHCRIRITIERHRPGWLRTGNPRPVSLPRG